ncbi:GumC family protein [Tropicimonas sp.]|uniref:GumC family protein n=1 Tax=Tropicimonas sp. TaxID=2067044 RepID=UPI003A8B32FF
MDDLRFYLSRFLRRFHWFLVIAVAMSAVAVTIALTLPPAYVSEVRMLVESQQIPDDLAGSTVATPAPELLQIIEQRLMTRENLLDIAHQHRVFPDQDKMSPDEIVQAMRAHTQIRSQSGSGQATVMAIRFEAYRAPIAAAVLNSYLSLILEEESRFRTGRAESTLDFFQQQATQLNEQLDETSRKVLEFKNAHSGALPETLDFQMSERASMQERISRIDANVTSLENQRKQLQLIYETTGSVANAGLPATPREQRLRQLEMQLLEAQGIYSETSPRVRQLRAQVEQAKAAVEAETQAGSGATPGEAPAGPTDASFRIQLADIESQISILEEQKRKLEARVAELDIAIGQTPANGVVLEGLLREQMNIQNQYTQAAANLARASTGERIEVMSRGQRITVVEPPTVPDEPTKPNRKKIAAAGILLGIAGGGGLVFLLEFLNRSPKRPEDIVSWFEVMPIATIPYVQTQRQLVVERSLKLSLLLIILVGVPVAIYLVHLYYLPLDLIADKVMNRLGVRL